MIANQHQCCHLLITAYNNIMFLNKEKKVWGWEEGGWGGGGGEELSEVIIIIKF